VAEVMVSTDALDGTAKSEKSDTPVTKSCRRWFVILHLSGSRRKGASTSNGTPHDF